MIFNEEDVALLEKCLKHCILDYERTSYSLYASPDEKIEARKKVQKINTLQFKVLNITENKLI
jgi:hypothetical protein|tara:strand:+ start:428 stop:616 length:189 start_codon:yes stop_codon:yes gene_type:complete